MAQYGLEQKPRESNATGLPMAHPVLEGKAIESPGTLRAPAGSISSAGVFPITGVGGLLPVAFGLIVKPHDALRG